LCDGSGLHVGREAILIRLPEQSLNSPRLLHHNIFTERLFDMVVFCGWASYIKLL